MKNLIKFLSMIILLGAFVATIQFLWNFRQHYGDWQKPTQSEDIIAKYNFLPLKEPSQVLVEAPSLPDISKYTVQAIKEKMPDVKPGSILVQNLEEGYRKMRNLNAFFGDKQNRLDPLSIVLQGGVYDLKTIYKDIDDETLIEKREDGTYVLHVPLAVNAEASLLVQEGETLLLSVNSGALISTFGNVYIYKATVKGWDTELDQPAAYEKSNNFRPHITAWCGANLHIAGSEIAHLGYQASKSYGVSYTSCTDTLYRLDYGHLPGGTGWIVDNKFNDIYFGFYSYEADDVAIIGNIYDKNIVYAIDPHDRSKNLIIAYNTTKRSVEKHGIIVSREVSDSYIFKNTTEENKGSGIMIDRSSHGNVIAYNLSQHNGRDGLTFYESPDNVSYKNILINNGDSGIRIRNSWNILSQEDVVNHNGVAGIQLYSLYLTPSRGATYRDLDLDPYVQKAGATFINTEMVGNKISNYKLEDFDYFEALAPRFYQFPKMLFAGELKNIDNEYVSTLFDDALGLKITSKKESNQNLTRSSVEPR